MGTEDEIINLDDFRKKTNVDSKNSENKDEGAAENNAEVVEEKTFPEGFDKALVGEVGKSLHGAENMKDFIDTLKKYDEVVFANGKEINGKEIASIVEDVARDLLSGKIKREKALTHITRTFGLRKNFEKLIDIELKKNSEVKAAIAETDNFSELYSVLEKAGDIHSTDSEASPNEWISAIESVRGMVVAEKLDVADRPGILSSITNNLGIRDKVRDLLIDKK